jgi:hypothetical protein
MGEKIMDRRLLTIYARRLNELHLFRRFGLIHRGAMQLSSIIRFLKRLPQVTPREPRRRCGLTPANAAAMLFGKEKRL